MFAVRLSWLFIFIEFIMIFGDRVVIGRILGNPPIQRYSNPSKFFTDDLPYGNFAVNKIDYPSVNRQPQQSADFVFPDKVFAPLPESLNNKFPSQDKGSKKNMQNYFKTVERNEAIPKNSGDFVGSKLAIIHKIRSRNIVGIFKDIPLISCEPGYQRTPAGNCKILVTSKRRSSR